MRTLSVYYNNIKAGRLVEIKPGGKCEFEYDSSYLVSDNPSISLTMPKRDMPYKSDSLFPFFTNLLPEGSNRKAICRHFKIDEEDLFSLLEAMAGKDFIGAVELRKENS